MNAVVLAVSLVLILSLFRVNVIMALCLGALAGGVWSGLTFLETVEAFQNGLGGGATIALSYGLLGAFAVAISRSGVTDVLARSIIERTGRGDRTSETWIKSILISVILLIAISSQNIVPIHIAFIPILIPPLLTIFAQLNIDRRLIACVITFGLATPFLILPVGFGGIYLFGILHKNLLSNGLSIEASDVPLSMLISATGMLVGLLIAVFFTYRKPRQYNVPLITSTESALVTIDRKSLIVSMIAIISALAMQLYSNSMIMGALAGILIFTTTGVVKWNQTQDLFSQGITMMAMISFIMIAASGFAEVMKTTGSITDLVASTSGALDGSQAMAAIMMLVIGLLITMGIGSSFSTVPIIAALYVPLCIDLGFSAMATAALVGTAGALGDAGSPASDSTLGPTAGLNADGQHDHIWDTVVPTFIHYNIPLLIFGWIAAMTL
ncbi:MAG: putative histidine transporter YuiF (NhaC family) [Halieaceae bacterium]|jgi:predicted histidine transporter YuiF (NhaC family)